MIVDVGLRLYAKQRRVDVVDETAGRVELHLAETPAVFRTSKNAMLLCTGDGHVEQTAFLLEFTHGASGHRTREDILLEANNEHRGKLKSLGAMYCHERDAALVVVSITIKIGEQRHFLQEIRE